jgi:hypothetical protein
MPRLRLTKYPLLVGEILRHTQSTHEDIIPLSKAASAVALLLQQTDVAVGAAKCGLIRKRLHFSRDHSSRNLVDKSTAVLCSGELKDRRGMVRNIISAALCLFTYDLTLLCCRSITLSMCVCSKTQSCLMLSPVMCKGIVGSRQFLIMPGI